MTQQDKIKLRRKELDIEYWRLQGKVELFISTLKVSEEPRVITSMLVNVLTANFKEDNELNTIYASILFKDAIISGTLTDELMHKLMVSLVEADVSVKFIRWVKDNLLFGK